MKKDLPIMKAVVLKKLSSAVEKLDAEPKANLSDYGCFLTVGEAKWLKDFLDYLEKTNVSLSKDLGLDRGSDKESNQAEI